MEETIINNIESISDEIVLRYCFYKNDFDLLHLIHNITIDSVKLIIRNFFKNSELYPSQKEIHKLNFVNLYYCYEFIKSINMGNINKFINAINNKDYSVELSELEYNLWIKYFFPEKPIPEINFSNLLEYIDMYHTADFAEFFNHMISYWSFRSYVVESDIIWNYIDKVKLETNIYVSDLVNLIIESNKNIEDYISLDTFSNVFRICENNFDNYSNTKKYLVDKLNLNFVEPDKELCRFSNGFGIASFCCYFNFIRYDRKYELNGCSYIDKWNEYYNISIKNSKLDYSDDYLIYSYSSDNKIKFSDYKLLYLDSYIHSINEEITPNIIADIAINITEFSYIIDYLTNKNEKFSYLYDKYKRHFLESLKYIRINSILFDIDISDPIISEIYNITKNNYILGKIIDNSILSIKKN